jgi:transglutaminase-like putative cysteine protease
MRLSVNYTTVYTYSEPPRSVIQLLRVTPLSFPGQTVLDWRLDVDCDSRLREGRDGYGNITHMLYVDHPVERLCISVNGAILTEDQAGVIAGIPNDLPPEVFSRVTELTAAGEAIGKLAAGIESGGGTELDRLHRLTAGLHQGLRFDTAVTAVETRGEEALAAGHGVCQDFAHIFIGASRLLGIPARYVSGHLFRRDGAHLQQAAHAWAEAWVGHLGWVAFDPANGICADDGYVRVACGLDYRDAAPVAGERSGGGREKLSVEVEVREGRFHSQSQSQFQA